MAVVIFYQPKKIINKMNTEYTMQTLPVRYWVIIGLLFFIAFMKNGR